MVVLSAAICTKSGKGKFYIKDEMAANGTFVNDEELEIEKAYPLKDGDIIKLANTVFIFKCSEIL